LVVSPDISLQAALTGVGLSIKPTGGKVPTFDVLHARWPTFFRRGHVGSWRDEMPSDIHDSFWPANRDAMLLLGYADDAPQSCSARRSIRADRNTPRGS